MNLNNKSDPQNKSLANISTILIADFQTTMAIQQAILSADYQAKQAESETLQRFSSYRNINDPYVKPTDIPFEEEKSLTNASLNSHLQLVQSEQIRDSGYNTINELQHNAELNYINKKITFKRTDKKLHPFHNCWHDKYSGEIRYGDNHSSQLTGKISEINLLNNYVIIKPSRTRMLVSGSLKGHLIEIIDPASGIPMVSII